MILTPDQNGKPDTGLAKTGNGEKMNYRQILNGIQKQLTKSVMLPQPSVDVKLDEEGDINKKSLQEGLSDEQSKKEAMKSGQEKIEELRPDNPSKDVPVSGETEADEKTLEEYKEDFLEMNIGSLTTIVKNSQSILESLEEEKVKENLTKGWLQGKIAITEDYMTTIHDFVKYSTDNDDKEDMAPASLWENIRKKKLREGKNYKPAQPGDKNRPTPEASKKAQKKKKK